MKPPTPRRPPSVRSALLVVALGALGTVACGANQNTTSPTPPPRSSPVTETFQGTLPLRGSVWRLITAVQAGPLTATLTASNQPTATVGLAVGLRNGVNCLATRDVVAPAGASPQVSLVVDGGDYCVRVWDPGQLESQLAFTVTITYP
jgi:hypothetical protein